MTETKTKKTVSKKDNGVVGKTVKKALAIKAEKAEKSTKIEIKSKIKTIKKDSGVYFEAVGRRKTSTARVRLFGKGDAEIIVNDKPMKMYFPTAEMQKVVEDPLVKMKVLDKFRITVKVSGGGIHSQSEAVRHGITRALIVFNSEFRARLKKAGFVTRDQRAKERRKFGLKKARKSPQWSKR